MTTITLWIVIIIAFGFGLMFVVTFLQMMNINKTVREINDVLECLWATLGYLNEKDIQASQKRVMQKVKKAEDFSSRKK